MMTTFLLVMGLIGRLFRADDRQRSPQNNSIDSLGLNEFNPTSNRNSARPHELRYCRKKGVAQLALLQVSPECVASRRAFHGPAHDSRCFDRRCEIGYSSGSRSSRLAEGPVLYGIKFVASYLLGTDIAGRNLKVFPDDIFIASYPRSGNTWTRFLLANLMHPERPVTFSNIETLIPDASALSSRQLKRVPRPRLIKTHEYFEPRYRKVIYLVRDPRDVVLSLYNFRRMYRSVDDSYPIEQYVAERFLPGDLDVSWGEHVGSWLGTRMNRPGFLLVRYEDLLQDPTRELGRMAGFLGTAANTEALTQAIERSSANRLRELEKV